MVFMSAGDNLSHELALTQISPHATGPDKDRVGLSHFAWQMDSFEDLKQLYQDMGKKGVKIGGIEDHGISIGVYFFDPGRTVFEFGNLAEGVKCRIGEGIGCGLLEAEGDEDHTEADLAV